MTTGFFQPITEMRKASKSLTLQQKIAFVSMVLEDAEALSRRQNHKVKFDIINIVDDVKDLYVRLAKETM